MKKTTPLLSGSAQPTSVRLRAGDQLPYFTATSLKAANRGSVHDLLGGPRILTFFTTSCDYCAQTVPVWQSIAESMRGSDLEVVGISLSSRQRLLQWPLRDELTWEIWITAEDIPALRLYGVPATLLVEADGTVIHMWRGALTEEQANEIHHLATGFRGRASSAAGPKKNDGVH